MTILKQTIKCLDLPILFHQNFKLQMCTRFSGLRAMKTLTSNVPLRYAGELRTTVDKLYNEAFPPIDPVEVAQQAAAAKLKANRAKKDSSGTGLTLSVNLGHGSSLSSSCSFAAVKKESEENLLLVLPSSNTYVSTTGLNVNFCSKMNPMIARTGCTVRKFSTAASGKITTSKVASHAEVITSSRQIIIC